MPAEIAIQVACTLNGCLAWISDPIPGSRHDNYCLGESEVLRPAGPHNWLDDKGYVGNNMITPFKKPEGGELLDWQKEFNTQVNQIRYVIEQVIANFKTWRIMHTDYRRPLATFPETISAVIALYFYAAAWITLTISTSSFRAAIVNASCVASKGRQTFTGNCMASRVSSGIWPQFREGKI
jgi:hypothetical protein